MEAQHRRTTNLQPKLLGANNSVSVSESTLGGVD
jgi:hypothetical protein